MPTTERKIIHIEIDSARAARQLRNIDKELEKTRRAAQGVEATFNRLNRVMGVLFLAGAVGQGVRVLVRMSDEYQELRGRVNIVARETVGLGQAMSDLNVVTMTTFSSFEGAVSLYARLGVATRELGLTHQQLIDITQLSADTLRISGASAKEASAFMTQFSQAMAANRFAGDEFRSMLESNVFMSQLLAEALQTNIGGLRQMAEDGKLTTRVVTSALLPAVEKVRKEAAALPVTVTRAWTNLETASQRLLNALNDIAGAMSAIAKVIEATATAINTMARGVEVLSSYISPEGADKFNLLMEKRLNLLSRIAEEEERLVFLGNLEASNDTNFFIERRVRLLNELRPQLADVNAELDAMRKAREALDRAPAPGGLSAPGEFGVTKLTLPERETPIGLYAEELEDYNRELGEFADRGTLATEKMKLLINTFNAGLTTEDFKTKLKELYPEIDLVTESSEEATVWTEALSTALGITLAQATSTAADAMVDFAIRGEGSFSNMAQSILESIAKMMTQFALMQILFGGQSVGAGGGLLGGFFPATPATANGAAFSDGNVIPFARGGVVSQPTLFPMARGAGLMGEAGPEAIIPLSRGKDGKLGVSGGGTVVNVYANESADVERSIQPDGRELIEVFVGEVDRRIMSGGSTWQAISQATGTRRAGLQR